MKEQRQKSLQLEVTANPVEPVPSIDRTMRAIDRAGIVRIEPDRLIVVLDGAVV
ncbi:hypothetical protein [Bradyrhizobium sp.]|uniref:hypothetical protein n=1 Tax=Bradyrhizobium sp. TaxID=376 RepID=UPI0025BD6501|nr:hypothetical protein [Bradyrhizobium sp.]